MLFIVHNKSWIGALSSDLVVSCSIDFMILPFKLRFVEGFLLYRSCCHGQSFSKNMQALNSVSKPQFLLSSVNASMPIPG